MEDEFLTIEEISKRLKVKDFTVRDWIRKKQLRAYQVGREYRVKAKDFDDFLERGRTDKEEDTN